MLMLTSLPYANGFASEWARWHMSCARARLTTWASSMCPPGMPAACRRWRSCEDWIPSPACRWSIRSQSVHREPVRAPGPYARHGCNGVEPAGLRAAYGKTETFAGERPRRLRTISGFENPACAKLTERNFAIVAELEAVAKELGRSQAQVALNWSPTVQGSLP